ncbi:uncharacterized protein NPIL_69511 [Nephila pilipes]|uniref:Uncharacterized protein n=1 Tax=Nephila pilipes TaxID=299642 RepID=A0A8X6UHD8_NEPPI|nr:uncharacterized protein NPIL_69511 [Nephila pilipes]
MHFQFRYCGVPKRSLSYNLVISSWWSKSVKRMLEVDVLRIGDLERDSAEESAALNASRLAPGDDPVSDSDSINKSCYISELNLREDMKNSSQTLFVAKLKSKTNLHSQKPYDQLSDREKRRLEEKNYRRTIRIQGALLHYGLNRLSYGMDQSLREDFHVQKNSTNSGKRRRDNSSCSVESEDVSSSVEDEEEIERNLDTWYQSVCEDDNCNSETHKSSRDLVRDYMDIEDQIEEVEKNLRNARLQNCQRTMVFNIDAELEKIRVFEKEIENLARENELLRTENERLRLRLPSKAE